MKKINIKLTYIDELLGTCSANPEIHAEFIASKAPDHASREEEVAAIGVEEAIDKAMTVFPKMDDGTPFLWDYQFKGFFKDSCGLLRRADNMKSKGLKAYKKEIDGLVFVTPRRIPLVMPAGPVARKHRPGRARRAGEQRDGARGHHADVQRDGAARWADAAGEGMARLRGTPRDWTVEKCRQGALRVHGVRR